MLRTFPYLLLVSGFKKGQERDKVASWRERGITRKRGIRLGLLHIQKTKTVHDIEKQKAQKNEARIIYNIKWLFNGHRISYMYCNVCGVDATESPSSEMNAPDSIVFVVVFFFYLKRINLGSLKWTDVWLGLAKNRNHKQLNPNTMKMRMPTARAWRDRDHTKKHFAHREGTREFFSFSIFTNFFFWIH